MKLDLKTLDIKDIANWQLLPKVIVLAALFVTILGAGYWFDWSQQLSELEADRTKEATLRETFLNKKKQAINLDTYKQQLTDIEQSFGALLKQLPNRSEMDALLIDINQAGLGRGLQFELFKPDAAEKASEFYAERPITIRISGNYHDLGAFASDISRLPRIVTLHNINITGGTGKDAQSGILFMDAVVKTYRYLDDEEMAEKKKKAQKDSKKEAK
jgi:type IV pilus assembly protein PilO